MRIYFARHGQTDDNLRGIIQGHKDTTLNSQGRLEARRLAKRLESIPFSEILSSSLSRARETAEICAGGHPGLEVLTEPGLMERGLGSLEGRRRIKGEPLPDDVESGEALRKRIIEWFQIFLERHKPHLPDPDYKVLIISHGAYLKTLLTILLGQSTKYWYKFKASSKVDVTLPSMNTSLMVVDVDITPEGRFVGIIESWGDVEHLKGLEDDEVLEVADDVRS